MFANADINEIADAVKGTSRVDYMAWLWALVALVGAVAVAGVVKFIVDRILKTRIDAALSALIARSVGYIIVLVGVTTALDMVGIKVGPLLGALGIAGVAIAFALRDILENFVAGIMLQLSRPFTYGDEVTIHDNAGVVTNVTSRVVTIEAPDGETILVPSATVIKTDVVNHTRRGGRRTDLEVGVAYGTGIGRARDVLRAALADIDGVRTLPEPSVLFVGFGDSSVNFVVRYWHDPSIVALWTVRDQVGEAIETALADAGIEIPFPQLTMWKGAHE